MDRGLDASNSFLKTHSHHPEFRVTDILPTYLLQPLIEFRLKRLKIISVLDGYPLMAVKEKNGTIFAIISNIFSSLLCPFTAFSQISVPPQSAPLP